MKELLFLGFNGLCLVAAGLAGFGDAALFDKTGTVIPLMIMFFTLIASLVGTTYFHYKLSGWFASVLNLTGFLLVMVNFPMYQTKIGSYSFTVGMLLVGVVFLLLANPGRLVSLLWLLASLLSFPQFLHFRSGVFHNFIIFNLALVASGLITIWQAASTHDSSDRGRLS